MVRGSFPGPFVSVTSDGMHGWREGLETLGRDVVKNVIRGTKCNSILVVDPGDWVGMAPRMGPKSRSCTFLPGKPVSRKAGK